MCPLGFVRASGAAAADAPTSGSLQAVVGVARAPSGGGQVIWDQLGDRQIHEPRGHAGHATGLTRVLHGCVPDRGGELITDPEAELTLHMARQ